MGDSCNIGPLGIVRIIGNELPCRDSDGGKLKALVRLVKREQFTGETVYVLNRIIDPAYKSKVLRILDSQHIIDLPVDADYYASLLPSDRLHYITNVNLARNIGIRHGQQRYHYTILLDASCYFDTPGWSQLVLALQSDAHCGRTRRYYALPTRRLPFSPFPRGFVSMIPLGEPMIAFRHDAALLFNESLLFGQNDKVELLVRLGASPETGKQHIFKCQDICRPAGYVLHEPAGRIWTELSLRMRLAARSKGLRNLLRQADARLLKDRGNSIS